MELTSEKNGHIALVHESSEWFDNFVAQVRSDELQMAAGTADAKMKTFYTSLIEGNFEEIMKSFSKNKDEFYLKKMLVSFFSELKSRIPHDRYSVHVTLSMPTIHVWAVIDGQDETVDVEGALYLAEATINAKNSESGYRIDTLVLEKLDNYTIPSQFKQLI